MQRIAGLAIVSLCAASLLGCANSERRRRPLPDPLLATRPAPPPVRAIPRPRPAPRPAAPRPRPRVAPRPKPRPATVKLAWSDINPGRLNAGKWDVIVLHHAAARNATPQGMHNHHLNTRKWRNGLGYHFVIGNGVGYPDGEVYLGPRWHRQLTGAHCGTSAGNFFGKWRPKNFFNASGIGICLIGDFTRESPTPKQLAALEQLVALLCNRLDIDPSNVYGHGEVTGKTACPGHLGVASIRQRVYARVARAQ